VERILIIMSTHENDLHNNYRLFDRHRQVDPEDIELAFQLQNATSVDQNLLGKIVYRYSASLYRLVEVLLFYRKMVAPSHDEILYTLQTIFERSITNIEKFHGSASVLVWLFDVSLQVVADHRTRKWLPDFRKKITSNGDLGVLHEVVSNNCKSIDSLPEKLRLPLILRYLFDLDLPDIADILHIQVSEVHLQLINGRKQLLTNPIVSHFDLQILSYIDGLLDRNSHELNQLLKHLAECELCQRYAIKINDLEKSLAVNFKERWCFPDLSKADLDGLIQTLLSEKQRPKLWWKEKLPLKQSIWIFALCVMFVGLTILFTRILPEESESPSPQTIEDAIAQSSAAKVTDTPLLTVAPTMAPTPLLIKKIDIDTNLQKLSLTLADLRSVGVSNAEDDTGYERSTEELLIEEELSTMNHCLIEAGRITGWSKIFLTKNGFISFENAIYSTSVGAQSAINKCNFAETVSDFWIVADGGLGDVNVSSIYRKGDGYISQFSYKNITSAVYVYNENPDLVEKLVRIVLDKLQKEPLVDAPAGGGIPK
jgi:DNA-directed RNA polymerase specialized sigma24 family protein